MLIISHTASNKLYQIGSSHQQCQRIHKCLKGSLQSLCNGHPPLVHTDEGGESQDQVPAGQQDLRTSFTPIRCSVGGCRQETKDTLIKMIALSDATPLVLNRLLVKMCCFQKNSNYSNCLQNLSSE